MNAPVLPRVIAPDTAILDAEWRAACEAYLAACFSGADGRLIKLLAQDVLDAAHEMSAAARPSKRMRS